MEVPSAATQIRYGTIENHNFPSDETGANVDRKNQRFEKKWYCLALLLCVFGGCFFYSYFKRMTRTGTIEEAFVEQSTQLPKLEALHWKHLSKNDTIAGDHRDDKENDEDWYVGYLQICNDGENHPFGYRAVSEPTAIWPIPCAVGQPAPVIRMIPGKYYKLILINNVEEPTNIHTHGLHISGVGHVDDITRSVDPGECLVYNYHILDTADVGTFWYHSHRHPLTSHQVAGGAHGLIIVDETKANFQRYPVHLQRFFRNEVLLQYTSIVDKGTNPNQRTNFLNGKMFNNTSCDRTALLNLTLRADQYYYFRTSFVVISDPINFMEFYPADACDVRVVAYDGVYRSKIPHETHSYKHMLTTSSRVDLAVQCHNNADIHFHQGSKGLESRLVSIRTILPANKVIHNGDDVTASPFWDAQLKTQWSPRRPYYMENLCSSSTIANDIWNISMDETMDGNGKKQVSMNHYQWDPKIPIRSIEINQVAEWTLWNTKGHPFHIHINRMQIVKGCGYRYEAGEYYDSIAAKTEACTVRLKFFDFAGRVVAHCHKLKHEDKGMMVWINVLGGLGEGVLGYPEEDCLALY